MVATSLLPTAFLLHLPLGDCYEYLSPPLIDEGSGQVVVGLSTISVHVSPGPEARACSLVPFAGLLDLGAQFPHIRSLELRSVLVQLDASPSDVPRFSVLESLSIDPWFCQLSGDAAITKYLLSMFPHMPRLKSLNVYAPMARPHVERPKDDLLQQHSELPFHLKRLVCFGTLSVAACAHLIEHSRGTLRELRINIVGHTDAEEAALIAAIAQAAPRLRVLDLRLRGDGRLLSRVAPIFAALSRVETLHVETPRDVVLQDTLALLVGAQPRTLSIRSPRDRYDDGAAVDMPSVLDLLQTPSLRNLTLMGFDLSVEETRALLAHCRARRIRYSTYMH